MAMELDFFKFVLNHPVLVAVFSIALYFVIVNTIKMKLSKVKMLTPSELAMLVNHDNAVVLDVRAANEFDAGHIVNSIHETETALESNNLAGVGKDKSKPVVVVDKDGAKTYELGGHLVKNGFENVYALRGGILMWQQCSLPLVKK